MYVGTWGEGGETVVWDWGWEKVGKGGIFYKLAPLVNNNSLHVAGHKNIFHNKQGMYQTVRDILKN